MKPKSSDCFMYNIKTNKWHVMPSMSTEYGNHASCCVGDWLYVLQQESCERLNVSKLMQDDTKGCFS